MPGVIMENGSGNGSHTNHDRDQRPNGVNGIYTSDKTMDKGKGRSEPQQNVTPTSPTLPNGYGVQNAGGHNSQQVGLDPDQLPDDIYHITEGYVDLKLLLTRMAQKTHVDLVETINSLSSMPLPVSVANMNGARMSTADDMTAENINKKLKLLKFAEDAHSDWTKALVITGWSREAQAVKKLIDLRQHLMQQSQCYDAAVDQLGNMRRDFYRAAIPNPDLKTAVEVLTTGKASWMPEFGYIPPAPLTPREVLKYLQDLNTVLSIRLNIHDYDSIPPQFKDYSIKSGRVTFKVAGEFEVDLGIGTEDPKDQWWFIDLRFIFSPSPSTLAPGHRYRIESKLNETLLKDGLTGCYKELHELVLTHKIREFARQASELSIMKWVDTLKVENLNRAMSIQYWQDRVVLKGLKSWVILGVHSGRRKDGRHDPKATSRLFLQWFRDSKEVTDVEIHFDTVNISSESLLKTVIAQHVKHILTSIYDKFLAGPLYATRELALSLFISESEPAESEMKVQLTEHHIISVKIEPITGRFVFSPAQAPIINEYLHNLNYKAVDPVAGGYECIEYLRCALITESVTTRGLTTGWVRTPGPGLKPDALNNFLPAGFLKLMWLRRREWQSDWHLLLCVTRSGENWQLIRAVLAPTPIDRKAIRVASTIKVGINSACPIHDYKFFMKLKFYTTGLLTNFANLKCLHSMKAQHFLPRRIGLKPVNLPPTIIRLSSLIASKNKSSRTGKPWAKDALWLNFLGLEVASGATLEENAVSTSEARLVVLTPELLGSINARVDPDIIFHADSGSFAFRLRSKVGETGIPILIERLSRVERLVEFVQVLQHHKTDLQCETVSLGKIVFTYGSRSGGDENAHPIYRATVDFSDVKGNMRLKLERGNPHLRIEDYLNKVLNGVEGLNGVATLLPLTLPILRAFDLIQTAWMLKEFLDRGELIINDRAVDWYMLRYDLKQPSQPNMPPKMRRVTLQIRMSHRKGEPWWHITRYHNAQIKEQTKDPDDLDMALSKLWLASGDGWQGMRSSGVAQAHGAEELICKIDEIVRTFPMGKINTSPPQLQQHPKAAFTGAPVAPMTPTKPSKLTPQQIHAAQAAQAAQQMHRLQQMQQMQRQQLQQPTPNHSQQSQGQSQSQKGQDPRHMHQIKREHETIEID